MNDTIHIRDLKVDCIVGVNDCERTTKQTVMIDIDMSVDIGVALESDDLNHTVDYRMISKTIQTTIAASNYFLLENLAARVAEICLENERVQAVSASAWKPGALRGTGNVGITVRRER